MTTSKPFEFLQVDLTPCFEPTLQSVAEMSDLFQLLRLGANDSLDQFFANCNSYFPIIEQMLNEAEIMLDKRENIFERKHKKRLRRFQWMEQVYLRTLDHVHQEAKNSLNQIEFASKQQALLSGLSVTTGPISITTINDLPLQPTSKLEQKENLPVVSDESPPMSPTVRSKSRQIGNLERSVRKLLQAQESKTPTAKDNVRMLMQSAKKSMAKSASKKASARSHSVGRNAASNTIHAGAQPKSPIRPPRVEPLTEEEFQSIPNYMRGRAQSQVLNHLVDEFNKVIEAKYKIMGKSPTTMSDIELKKHAQYKEQENAESKGHFFVTPQDLNDYSELKVASNSTKIFLNCLRHCKRIKEIRGPNKLIRYAVLRN